jgi:hypothetical protein
MGRKKGSFSDSVATKSIFIAISSLVFFMVTKNMATVVQEKLPADERKLFRKKHDI